MKKESTAALQLIGWHDVRTKVKTVNPVLADLLDNLADDKNLPLVLAHYPFGKDILKAGRLFLPDEKGETFVLDKNHPSTAVTELLGYSKIPIGIILEKSVEVYYETPQRIIVDKIWYAGETFGIWEFLDLPSDVDSSQLSNLSSGARSIFMLPKITDRLSHDRLKKNLGIRMSQPHSLREHRDLFAEIVAKSHTPTPWCSSILYLTNEWFKTNNGLASKALKIYFYQKAWAGSYNCRRQFEWQLDWENTLNKLSHYNVYLSPRISSHLKQLYLIAEGIFPGMVFAKSTDNEVAPIQLIENIYRDIYQLKNYEPLMMHPNHLQFGQSVYYSLNYPNYFETHIPIKSVPRLADELRFIADTVHLIEEKAQLRSNPQFDFYHSHVEAENFIRPCQELIQQEPTLAKFKKENLGKSAFPENSLFFHGFVRVGL